MLDINIILICKPAWQTSLLRIECGQKLRDRHAKWSGTDRGGGQGTQVVKIVST